MPTYTITPLFLVLRDRPLQDERQVIKQYALDVKEAHHRLVDELNVSTQVTKRLRWFTEELFGAVVMTNQLADVELENKGR